MKKFCEVREIGHAFVPPAVPVRINKRVWTVSALLVRQFAVKHSSSRLLDGKWYGLITQTSCSVHWCLKRIAHLSLITIPPCSRCVSSFTSISVPSLLVISFLPSF